MQSEYIAILSDVHINRKAQKILHGYNLTDNLVQAVDAIRSHSHRPSCVVVNGDIAGMKGIEGDYRQFAKLIEPLERDNIPIHVTLGNHDHYGRFASAIPQFVVTNEAAPGRQCMMIETAHANLFILDSSGNPRKGNGVGSEQVRWMYGALRERADKPAIVFTHHQPEFGWDMDGKSGGLYDTAQVWGVIQKHAHVKAWLSGHIHTFKSSDLDGVRMVSLPSTGYDRRSWCGWAMIELNDEGFVIVGHPFNADPITTPICRW